MSYFGELIRASALEAHKHREAEKALVAEVREALVGKRMKSDIHVYLIKEITGLSCYRGECAASGMGFRIRKDGTVGQRLHRIYSIKPETVFE